MKRLIKIISIAVIISTIIAIAFYFFEKKYHDEIYLYYRDHILKVQDEIKLEKNKYYRDKNYAYVQNTNDFVAKDQKHLLNIFYTLINSGTEEFAFFCSKEYTNCINDIIALVEHKETLSNINNFVHPYNTFQKINTSYDDYGEVHIKIEKVYSEEDIVKLNQKVDEISKTALTTNMNNKQKIEAIHNYIINHGDYATDSFRYLHKDKEYNKANDILFDGYGLCSSYSDAMAIFLNNWNIDNYRIASSTHVWNLVNIDGKWLHLDLTWDDPIISDGSHRLEKLFLLINNDELKKLNVEKHEYDKTIYQEAA